MVKQHSRVKWTKIFWQLKWIHYLQGDITLENIFRLLVSQEKIFVDDPKKGIS